MAPGPIIGSIALAAALWILPGIARPEGPPPLFLSTAPPEQESRQGFRHESEHRAVPVRKYWLSTGEIPEDARAFVFHPAGTSSEVGLERGAGGISLSFGLPMGDGTMHGVHNSYVVATEIAGEELLVRVAKWMTIHHSCSWGHDYKYVPERTRASHLGSVPLEIVCQKLWDGNFHSRTRSGDTVEAEVLHFGQPVEGARVRLTTAAGWSRETPSNGAGVASFQLIRDYYPESWKDFSANHRGRFTLVAEYVKAGAGEYLGKPYARKRYLSSVSWTFSPARQDYSSYKSGLFAASLGLSITGLSIVFYRQRRQRPYKEVVFDERD